MNKRGLADTLGRAGFSAAKARFDDFMMGFNLAAERFIMVDVGSAKEAADAKIKGTPHDATASLPALKTRFRSLKL